MTGELAAHKEEKTLELVGKNENHAQMQLHELLETKVSREKAMPQATWLWNGLQAFLWEVATKAAAEQHVVKSLNISPLLILDLKWNIHL